VSVASVARFLPDRKAITMGQLSPGQIPQCPDEWAGACDLDRISDGKLLRRFILYREQHAVKRSVWDLQVGTWQTATRQPSTTLPGG
jgi:hypothetical protein